MVKYIIERCLSMVTVIGLLLGGKKRKKGWIIASLVSTCIHLGILIERILNNMDNQISSSKEVRLMRRKKPMKDALNELSLEQIKFICAECKLTKEILFHELDEEQIYDQVYEKMCDIEIEEVCKMANDVEDTRRCEIASDIVTIMGNALRKSEGSLWKLKGILGICK